MTSVIFKGLSLCLESIPDANVPQYAISSQLQKWIGETFPMHIKICATSFAWSFAPNGKFLRTLKDATVKNKLLALEVKRLQLALLGQIVRVANSECMQVVVAVEEKYTSKCSCPFQCVLRKLEQPIV